MVNRAKLDQHEPGWYSPGRSSPVMAVTATLSRQDAMLYRLEPVGLADIASIAVTTPPPYAPS